MFLMPLYELKDKILLIVMYLLAIASIEILLLAYNIGIIVKLYVAIILILVLFIAFFY